MENNSIKNENSPVNGDKDMGIIQNVLQRAVDSLKQTKESKRSKETLQDEKKGLGNVEVDIPQGVKDESIKNWFEIFRVENEIDRDMVRGIYEVSGGDLDSVLEMKNKIGSTSGTGQLQNLYNYLRIKNESDKINKELSKYENINRANEGRREGTSEDRGSRDSKDIKRDAKGRFI